mgnify:CR=1 FL=1
MPIEDITTAIARRAWQSRFYLLPESARKVPTMMTPEESSMLCFHPVLPPNVSTAW